MKYKLNNVLSVAEAVKGIINSTVWKNDEVLELAVLQRVQKEYPDISYVDIYALIVKEVRIYHENKFERKLLAEELTVEDVANEPEKALELLKRHWSNELTFLERNEGKNDSYTLGVSFKYMFDKSQVKECVKNSIDLSMDVVDQITEGSPSKMLQNLYARRNDPALYLLILTMANEYANIMRIREEEFMNEVFTSNSNDTNNSSDIIQFPSGKKETMH